MTWLLRIIVILRIIRVTITNNKNIIRIIVLIIVLMIRIKNIIIR